MKVCTKCKIEKDFECFYKRNSRPIGYVSECKECNNKRTRYPSRIAASRKRHLRVKFGLSEEDYKNLLNKQEGLCAICKNVCKTGRRLAVDHNHSTGHVRGLLCTKCNNGLGNFNDDTEVMECAIRYLNG